LPESFGGRIGGFPLSILFHHGSLCSCRPIMWGMNNRLVGGHSSETNSHPIYMITTTPLCLHLRTTVIYAVGLWKFSSWIPAYGSRSVLLHVTRCNTKLAVHKVRTICIRNSVCVIFTRVRHAYQKREAKTNAWRSIFHAGSSVPLIFCLL
jgi:hypothetical protein